MGFLFGCYSDPLLAAKSKALFQRLGRHGNWNVVVAAGQHKPRQRELTCWPGDYDDVLVNSGIQSIRPNP